MGKRTTPTQRNLLTILSEREWTPYSAVTAAFARNPCWRRTLRQFVQDGIVERRAETLTTNRGPGWIHDLLVERGMEPWSDAAYDLTEAHRLTPKGRSLCAACGILTPDEAEQRQWEALQATGGADG